MNTGLKSLLIIAAMATLLLISGCGPVESDITTPQIETDSSTNTTASKVESPAETPPTQTPSADEEAPGSISEPDAGLVNEEVSAVSTALCPLTGLPVNESLLDNRPLFVSISQFPAWASRPPTGLNSAPVVFETLLNEGMTRLQALFYCGYPQSGSQSGNGTDFSPYEISAVRSGRIFYAELAKLFNAGLIFGGASPEVYPEIAPYQCSSTQNTNTPSNTGAGGLNIDRLEQVAENCQTPSGNTDLGVWLFGPAPDGGTPVESFLMKYNYLNQTRWVYDTEAGGYVRYQNDPSTPEEFSLSTDRLT
ncbi:MAG: DUF3048 domain-containing protein, partial [Anaerolineales bacterium]